MKDIDLCSGVGCPLREKCKRYLLGFKSSRPNKVVWWLEPKFNNGKCKNYYKER